MRKAYNARNSDDGRKADKVPCIRVDHVYERVKPKKGVYYFNDGSSGQLRHDGLAQKGTTDRGFANDRTFMLVEVAGDELYFETLTRKARWWTRVNCGSRLVPLSRHQREANEPFAKEIAFGNAVFAALLDAGEALLVAKPCFLDHFSLLLARATLPLTTLVNRQFSRFAATTGGETIKNNLKQRR